MSAAAALVDAAAPEPVLVFGSPPPAGRDLDLLARPGAARAVAERLAAEGFLRRGVEWVRFDEPVSAVDLVPVADWGLPAGEVEALFATARPIDGYARLVRPGPAEELLVLARLPRSPKRAARLAAALAEPGALDAARARADAWGVRARLEALVAGASEPASSRARRAAARRLRRPPVIALSGVDGSGKSTQARALQQLLAQLGHEAEIAWTPLASDPWIGRLARPVKRALGRLRSLRVDDDVAPEVPGGLVPNPGSRLRERSRAVNWAWAALVAFANGRSHRRLARRHAHAGKVVIFDRYVLDSLVRIRFLYGERPRFRLQRALVRALSPRPAVAVLLDVPAEVSLARKDDRWTAAELERQVALYRAEHAAAGVLRLDGTRPYEELRAELAELAWRALP